MGLRFVPLGTGPGFAPRGVGRGFASLLVGIALLSPGWTHAERLYVVDDPAVLEELQRLLAPAPLYRADNGKPYFEGRILDYVHPSGDVDTGDLDRVKFLVVAYGDGGSQRSEQAVLISMRHMQPDFLGEFDATVDFRRLLSNRHELAGLDPASEAYREYLLGLFDPHGDLGLYTGDAPPDPTEGSVQEGTLTHWVLYGGLAPEERNRAALRFPWDPRILGDDVRADRILNGAARSALYDGFPQGFRARALRVVGLLCALAEVDVDFAPAELTPRARRLRDVGLGAIAELAFVLGPTPPDQLTELLGDANPRMPLDNETRMRAALEVVLTEPGLRAYHADERGIVNPTRLMDMVDYGVSRGLVSALVTAGGGVEDDDWIYVPDPEIRELGVAAFARLMMPAEDEDPRVTRRYRDDRRAYRMTAYSEMLGRHPGQRDHARDALERAGWGPTGEAVRIAETVAGRALRYAGSSRDNADELLRASMKILHSIAGAHRAARRRIEETVQEHRETARRREERGDHDTRYHRFVRAWGG